MLPRAQDAPPATSARPSDEDAGRQDLFQVVACHPEAGKTDSAPQLVDIGGDMETRRQESLHNVGTRTRPEETQTAGTCHSGGTEGGKDTAGGGGGKGYGQTADRGYPPSANHGGGCRGGTDRRWTTPCRPLE